MERPFRRMAAAGALAGLAASAVVAVWYLALDLAAGQPFETPARLAAVFLERPREGIAAGSVLAYSVLHFGVFALVGGAAGGFLALTRFNPGLLVGTVLGLGVMTSLYYSGLALAGAADLGPLGLPHVLGSNLAAGLTWAGVLGWTARGKSTFGIELLDSPLLERSVVTGLVGAGAVALWFLLLDAVRGQPLFTPAALGSALLGQAAGDTAVRITPGVVAFYTVLHLGAFTLAGLLFTLAAERLERSPGLLYLAVMAFIVLDAVFFPVVALLGEWLMGTLAIWAMAVANALAVGAMTWWTWRTHPELREALERQGAWSPRA